MERTQNWMPLKRIQTTNNRKRFKNTQDDHDQPLSPTTRLLHEPGANLYIIAIAGMKTQIDPDIFKAHIFQLIDKNYRFCSLQVLDKENGSMTWVPTHVNLNEHIVVPELDPNMSSSDKFIEEYISGLSRSGIENSKPLWDLHILNTKTSNAQGTCILRCHHSLGDGISLMSLLLACSRKASDPEALPTLPQGKASGHHLRVTSFRSLFMSFWNSIVALVMFILMLFLKDTKTPLKGSPCTEDRPRRFALKTVSLNDIKMVKNAMHVTVNDVVGGVLQAGLYRYLNRRYAGKNNNRVPKSVHLRALIPFNMRASSIVNAFPNSSTSHGSWGNKLGYVLVPLSMRHKEDPLDHVREINTIMERKKASFEPFWTAFIASLVIKVFGFKIAGKLHRKIYSSVTLCFSNIPGPQEELSLFGHQISYIAPTCYGFPTELVIHVVSYVDKLTFVVSADEETLPDPNQLCDDLQHSLKLMKTSSFV